MTRTFSSAQQIAVRSLHLMGDGTYEEFKEIVHPDATNRECDTEPRATRGRGPDAYWATALWLRGAYGDLRWEVHEAVGTGELVALHTTMSGRQIGTFVVYDEQARPAQAFPSTGKTFSVTQTHWFRVRDGQVIEHWANRDDLGNATQLGWVPPTPIYLARMRLALRRARRTA